MVLVLASGGAGAISFGDLNTTPVSTVAAEDDPDEEDDDTRHENPDDADGEGDDDELSGWLADQLAGSLGDSTIQLSEGEYDSAREVLGDDYDDRLDQFVEVDGDTADDDDSDEEEDTGEAFRDAKENQEELTDAVEEYEETRGEYEQALADGDDQRARELARELDDIEDRVTESAGNLDQAYRIIGDRTRADLSEERETIAGISEEISQTQSEIREFVFVATELTIDTELATGSFADPIRVEGELTAADDSVLDDERIRIKVDGRTTETTTENGLFEIEYRPALLNADADEVTIEFVPDPASQYLESSAPAPVDIDTVEPTIEINSSPESVAYGDTVTLDGTAHVDGSPIDHLPVRAQFSDRFQGDAVRTDADGSFTTTVTVPAEVPDGDADVMAIYDQSERAVSPTNESAQLQVELTSTQIDADAEADDDGVVYVTGTLRTEDGVPVSGQSVRLASDGSPVGTVETNADGEFSDSVEFSQNSIPEDGMLGITVAYDGTGTNLEDSEESLAVAMSLEDGGDSGSSETASNDTGIFGDSGGSNTWSDNVDTSDLSAWHVVGILTIIALVAVVALYFGRRSDTVSMPALFGSRTNSGETVDPQVTNTEPETGEHSNDRAAMKSIGEVSNDLLDAGRPNAAVITAYERTREQLAEHLDETGPRTYWEFYRDWRESEETDSEPLRVLTERYERATFTGDPIESEDAADAIDRAVELVEGDSA